MLSLLFLALISAKPTEAPNTKSFPDEWKCTTLPENYSLNEIRQAAARSPCFESSMSITAVEAGRRCFVSLQVMDANFIISAGRRAVLSFFYDLQGREPLRSIGGECFCLGTVRYNPLVTDAKTCETRVKEILGVRANPYPTAYLYGSLPSHLLLDVCSSGKRFVYLWDPRTGWSKLDEEPSCEASSVKNEPIKDGAR